MKTTTALNAFVSSAALALTLGLSTAAQAGDFDFGHPELSAQPQRQAAAPAEQPAQASAPAARRSQQADRSVRGSVSTEESRAMLGEDSGSFWIQQQWAQPAPTKLTRADTVKR